jgi:hypothetical protein
MLDTITPEKSQVAKMLAEAHRKVEPGINRIFRVISDREQEADEPVKLLEVNPDTSPSGIFPIAFNADPPTIPFPSVVIEVTEVELEKICAGSLLLPDGWRLDELIWKPAA